MASKRRPGAKTGKKTGMAHRQQRKTPWRLPAASSWAMLLIGLFSGSVLTALYLGMQDNGSSGIGSGLKWWLDKKNTPKVEAVAKPAPKTTPIPTPKFDFYHILETERVVPETVFENETGPAASRETGNYVLQVASYKSDTHADRLRAKLALAGLEARIQKFQLADKSVVFRVVLGPYPDKRTLKVAKQKVAKLGLDAIVLRSSP